MSTLPKILVASLAVLSALYPIFRFEVTPPHERGMALVVLSTETAAYVDGAPRDNRIEGLLDSTRRKAKTEPERVFYAVVSFNRPTEVEDAAQLLATATREHPIRVWTLVPKAERMPVTGSGPCGYGADFVNTVRTCFDRIADGAREWAAKLDLKAAEPDLPEHLRPNIGPQAAAERAHADVLESGRLVALEVEGTARQMLQLELKHRPLISAVGLYTEPLYGFPIWPEPEPGW